MLTFTDDYKASLPCPVETLSASGSILFFDIETTGLSAKNSYVYLIGSLCTDGSNFHLIQWFAQSSSDESDILAAFQDYLDSLPSGCTLYHFNGNHFDIPYLRQRYDLYEKTNPVDSLENVDLYLMISPYRRVLGLSSLRQKSIENYLGIEREDPFDGGQLITVYEDYVRTHSTSGLDALLLHNAEDLRNMPKLLTVCSLSDCLSAKYKVVQETLHSSVSLDGQEQTELMVRLDNPFSLPHPVSQRLDSGIYLTASGSRISLAVPVTRLELKHYFDDPQNYYYLPEEDRAVHKSVGIYVDRDHRRKAVRENCYVRKEGNFIPCPEGLDISAPPLTDIAQPLSRAAFRQDYRNKEVFLEWNGLDAAPWKNCPDAFWSEYVHTIWKSS